MDLQKRLDEAARRHDVPGAAIAVWTGTELVEAATGVLNRNTGVETTTDSLFQVGSTTKIWTSALVMRLVEEGLVDLDTPVRTYLPEFAVADPEVSETVTVRHLLTHTSGIAGDLFEDTGRGDDSLDRYIAFLHDAGQAHAPGELFSYCNSGFVVLGALAARFGGGTWEETMRERLLDPLGVTHVGLLPEEAILFRASAGHVGPDNAVNPHWQMPRSNAPAGSTMCLAPRELVRFGRMFLNGGEGVLKAETIAAMTTPQVDVPGVGGLMADRWGLGFELFDWGAPVIGHDGGTIGQSTFWRIIPGSDVTLAMSGNGGGFLGLVDELALPVIRELTGLPVPALPTPPEQRREVDAAPYIGTYSAPSAVLEVTAADGGLDVTTIPGEFMAKAGVQRRTERYVHLSGQTFITVEAESGGHLPITFVLEGGRAAYLHNGRAVPRA